MAIAALFRVVNRNVGNLPPMPGVFPDYPGPVVRNADREREMTTMRWGMPPPWWIHPEHVLSALAAMVQRQEPLFCAGKQLCRVRA